MMMELISVLSLPAALMLGVFLLARSIFGETE